MDKDPVERGGLAAPRNHEMDGLRLARKPHEPAELKRGVRPESSCRPRFEHCDPHQLPSGRCGVVKEERGSGSVPASGER